MNRAGIRNAKALIKIFTILLLTALSSIYIFHEKGMSSQLIFSDLAIFTNESIYLGFLSQIGLFLWSASAAICFYSAHLLQNKRKNNCYSTFFRLLGAFTSLILFDDAFCVHEVVMPLNGVSEDNVYVFYLVIIFCILFTQIERIKSSNLTLLLTTVLLLAASQVIDAFAFVDSNPYIDWEELLKFGGIISWLSYIQSTSSICVESEINSSLDSKQL